MIELNVQPYNNQHDRIFMKNIPDLTEFSPKRERKEKEDIRLEKLYGHIDSELEPCIVCGKKLMWARTHRISLHVGVQMHLRPSWLNNQLVVACNGYCNNRADLAGHHTRIYSYDGKYNIFKYIHITENLHTIPSYIDKWNQEIWERVVRDCEQLSYLEKSSWCKYYLPYLEKDYHHGTRFRNNASLKEAYQDGRDYCDGGSRDKNPYTIEIYRNQWFSGFDDRLIEMTKIKENIWKDL